MRTPRPDPPPPEAVLARARAVLVELDTIEAAAEIIGTCARCGIVFWIGNPLLPPRVDGRPLCRACARAERAALGDTLPRP